MKGDGDIIKSASGSYDDKFCSKNALKYPQSSGRILENVHGLFSKDLKKKG